MMIVVVLAAVVVAVASSQGAEGVWEKGALVEVPAMAVAVRVCFPVVQEEKVAMAMR